ncbi:cobalt/nickel transport protein [Desulfitobacterium sp. LBE]|uniref:Cobalt transport protein CbiN n=5 Tax=root TaxID=1 RepID=Q24XH3_DESHY|nr:MULTISPECIES: energy-coupling factor ABC transporter substrate-binding protein [Desulfitobacterium]ACL20629.1 cobalt transport protein [Desulfitobacterium hafniense DCB-2]EHL06873.1 cobalt transport protein [Desulfitobacterium hafniense DP7]KTE90311.1 cobalamin biosynthesis protein CbiN [Desulfitobacterium hafniense]MEA5023620.1 energy-coupling factor ABC transporter substrate-binding protein [Desulfitobacterium hafniense]TWH56542.1 cobalt/nickel transport protein [Desulfitobacterium sp. LB
MANSGVEQTKRSTFKVNVLLFLLVVAITVIPLVLVQDAEFGGADGLAEEEILNIQEDYEPWFSPFFEPASGEIESLLFALQAGLGAGVIGFGLGYYKGRSKHD